jgi:hypothetical protein
MRLRFQTLAQQPESEVSGRIWACGQCSVHRRLCSDGKAWVRHPADLWLGAFQPRKWNVFFVSIGVEPISLSRDAQARRSP